MASIDMAKFNDQLIDVVAYMILHQKCGSSVHTSVANIAGYAPEPSATAWASLNQETDTGVWLGDALNHLLEWVPSDGLALVVDAFHKNWQERWSHPLSSVAPTPTLIERLEAVLEILWDWYSPETKPGSPAEQAIRDLFLEINNGDDTARINAKKRLVAMKDHALVYLIDGTALGMRTLPLADIVAALKEIRTDWTIKYLTRYAQYKSSGYNAVACAALDELGVRYESSQDEAQQ